jgi:hypothetical protein
MSRTISRIAHGSLDLLTDDALFAVENTPTKFLEVQVAGHGPSTSGDSSVEPS